MKKYKITSVLAGIVGAFVLAVQPALAAGTLTVAPGSLDGWTDQSAAGGTVSYVDGAPAGLGEASLELKTSDDNASRAVYSRSESVALSDVNELSYWTKQVAATAEGGSASFFVGVDLNGDGTWDTNLIHEPYWQNEGSPDTAPVVAGEWQQWDVDAGLFWSSRSYDGVLTAGAGGPPFYTLAQVQEAFPNALVTGYGVNVGTYNPNYTILVDGVVFNGTTYNFEMVVPDTTAPDVPEAIGATSPVVACGGTTDSNTVTLGWTDESASGAVSYQYQVMTPQRATWDDAWTVNTATNSYSGAFTEGEGDYTYRVAAVDASGNVSAWSNECVLTYDTTPEPVVLTNKDQCKKGGWEAFGFKNQGLCIASVQSSENSRHRR